MKVGVEKSSEKGPDVGTLVPGTREKNWGWYLVLGMGNKVGTWYSGRKKMGLVPGIRGEIGFGTGTRGKK